jgi:CheY-like chemotaxis protein
MNPSLPPMVRLVMPFRKRELYAQLRAARADRPGQEPPPPVEAAEAPAEEERATAPAIRALLVEDNMINSEVACEYLRRAGCVVDTADNGKEAVEQFSRERYDIVFMDCQMPVMDGFEAARAIRIVEREAAGQGGHTRTPVIALTANALSEERERCAASGMDDFLIKPTSQARITAVLRQWVAEPKPVMQNA